MMNTTNNDSGLNLDHLEACPFCRSAKVRMVVRDDTLDAVMCDDCTAEGPAFNDKARAAAAWNRRAAPVSAPIAGDALVQELLEYAGNPGYSHNDYADTMRRAAAALANQPAPTLHPSGRPYLTNAEAAQWARDNGLAYPPEWDHPAPTAAPEQVAQVHLDDDNWMDVALSEVPVWERKKFKTRVLYAAPISQPSEAAPLDIETAAKAIYELLPPCQGVTAKDYPWQPGGNSMKQEEARDYARAALKAIAAPSLPAAAPAPTVPAGDAPDCPVDGLQCGIDSYCSRCPHQPAQEQAEPLSEAQLDRIARSYFSEQWAVAHVKDAIHDAFMEAAKVAASPVVRAQSEESEKTGGAA